MGKIDEAVIKAIEIALHDNNIDAFSTEEIETLENLIKWIFRVRGSKLQIEPIFTKLDDD